MYTLSSRQFTVINVKSGTIIIPVQMQSKHDFGVAEV